MEYKHILICASSCLPATTTDQRSWLILCRHQFWPDVWESTRLPGSPISPCASTYSAVNFYGRDNQGKYVVNNVYKPSCMQPWQNCPYTKKVLNQKEIGRTTRHNRHSEQTLFFIYIHILYLIKWFIQEMLSNRHGTVNDLHCVFKPV